MSKKQVFLAEEPHMEEVWPTLDGMIEDLVEDTNPYDALNEEDKEDIVRGMREFMLGQFEMRKIASREDVYEYLEIGEDDEDDLLDEFNELFID